MGEPEKELYLDNKHELMTGRQDGHHYCRCWHEDSLDPGGTAMLHQNEFGDYWCDFCSTTFPQPTLSSILVRNEDGTMSRFSL